MTNTLDFGVKNMPEYLGSVDELVRASASESSSIAGLQRLLGVHGKMLRPRLVIAIAFYSKKPINEDVIRVAAAVELVHIASLVHDDIIDAGVLRHGVATINAREGNTAAILAGDYLLAKGFLLACKVSVQAGEVLADAIGNLCEGQAKEISDAFNVQRTESSLLAAIDGKTCSLFRAACVMGGLVAGLDKQKLTALTGFAHNYGVYFQYLDDIHDFTSSREVAGKSVGNDIREGNYTLPVILTLQGSHRTTLQELLNNGSGSSEQINTLLMREGAIDRARNEAEKYKNKALDNLQVLDSDLAKALRAFADRHM